MLVGNLKQVYQVWPMIPLRLGSRRAVEDESLANFITAALLSRKEQPDIQIDGDTTEFLNALGSSRDPCVT